MKKVIVRISACLIGLAIGLAAIQPVQAWRLGDAICSNNADNIYAFVQNTGFSREDVDTIVQSTAGYRAAGYGNCNEVTLRGALVMPDGTLAIIVLIGKDLVLFQFDPVGTLVHIS